MSAYLISIIYFVYGLAFYSMGFAIFMEAGRGTDERLRHALRPLAVFGLIHGAHEWMEMFDLLHLLPTSGGLELLWTGIRLCLLAFSFLSLGAFGSSLLARNAYGRRISLLLPLGLAAIWGIGLLFLRGTYIQPRLFDVADVWTRYTLAIPSALFACSGLLVQQRRFRQAGMAQFGRDALWSAIALFWYGIIGQSFTRYSPLLPSTVINEALFSELFGFPVQMLRAVAAGLAALFVIRFLRSFEVETQNQIAALQLARLEEAERREALRGELLRRVVEAQEAERQRIARELHDETGQALTAIGLGLRGANSSLQQDLGKTSNTLRQLEGLVARALTELQRLIADLRPSHLDDLGLVATLRWYTQDVMNRTSLEVVFDVAGDPQPLPSEVKTTIFRVVQEAITNIIKHAKAHHVNVRLNYENGSVAVRIVDDGTGFDITRLDRGSRPSWGLLGMRERASLLGGTFNIESRPGLGTNVSVVIPFSNLPVNSTLEEKEHEDPIAVGR